MRGEEAAHGDIQDYPPPPPPHRPTPPAARRVEEREKEDGRVVEKKVEEARNWPMGGKEARHIVGGGKGKILGRVDDGPMGKRV